MGLDIMGHNLKINLKADIFFSMNYVDIVHNKRPYKNQFIDYT